MIRADAIKLILDHVVRRHLLLMIEGGIMIQLLITVECALCRDKGVSCEIEVRIRRDGLLGQLLSLRAFKQHRELVEHWWS